MKPPGTNAGSDSISRLAPQLADRQPRIPPPSTSNAPNSQNSNRECFRLETAVTQRKERTQASSNREIEALFFGPSRGGSFLSDPPAVRPRFRGRVNPAKLQIPPSREHQNSNRESLQLETAVTQTKQTVPLSSNREVEALFSTAKRLQITIPADRGRPNRPALYHQKGEQNSNRESLLLITSNREKGACFSPAMRTQRRKPNSRPPTFVAIRKNYVIGFIRLKEVF
jgi:hypothetical protein